MHEFGKGTVGNSRTKNGRVITVNPPALSRRSFKVPGRGPAPLGRHLKQKNKKIQLVVSENDDYIAKTDKAMKNVKKKVHNFASNVENNETLPKRHTKQ